MKFRYKVLAVNLILLSLSLGVVGYLMISRNFELSREGQIQNAVVENNLLQYSVEYEILQVMNNPENKTGNPENKTGNKENKTGNQETNISHTENNINNSENAIKDELINIGARVADGINATESSFYIRYGEDFVFSSDGKERKISRELFEGLTEGKKNYIISKENDKYYTYITSNSTVEDKALCVINKYDISGAYELMESQIGYFRVLLIVVLLIAAVVMYFVSVYLTKPLERLNSVTNEIAQGNYGTRVSVNTGDEIGDLSGKFNQMAEAVENHIDELSDMVRRRERFVADFTHEIKTPMTTIIGYADTLRSREIQREDQIVALNYIFSEGKRLEKMSAKLFELIYLKQKDIEKATINTENLGKNITEISMPILKQKNITMVTNFEPAVILGNQELLISAFINVIDNAKKASDNGGSIYFIGKKIESAESECKSSDGYVFEVVDNGIGMSKKDVNNICDEFYMVDKSRSRKEGGAGLGMSIVKMILDKHNAKMEIDSELNMGTTIRIVFPEIDSERGITDEKRDT